MLLCRALARTGPEARAARRRSDGPGEGSRAERQHQRPAEHRPPSHTRQPPAAWPNEKTGHPHHRARVPRSVF